MPKGSGASGPGIFSATYSGIPVYEFQFGTDLKEHVMRRRHDDWINATHILKAAGFDKPARTRILEREVQKDTHEKIQGGYGKYQGTWIPLEHGEALAKRNNIWDRLRPIFEFAPGVESPPPAPRHASKPKAARRPAVPKWTAAAAIQEEYEQVDAGQEDDTPDNLTIASASYMAEEDHHDMSHFSTGHRKRKREELIRDMTDQQHSVYGDELLDYFLLSRNAQPAVRPDPPPNFQPNWCIDHDRHTALHWAASMGDLDVIKQLRRFGADIGVRNNRGETPFMRAVNFTNCYDKQTFPMVVRELFDTVSARDATGCTVLHHAAGMKSGRVTSTTCARYYIDCILNRLHGTVDPHDFQLMVDAQDNDGNTAIHLAAMKGANKCIRALIGRGAYTNIQNNDGLRAEDIIQELNSKKAGAAAQRSSSPFGPESQRHPSFRDVFGETQSRIALSFRSDAAISVHSRITPLVMDKFQDLAQNYDEELKEKEEAEKEARRLLTNAQSEMAGIRTQLAQLEAQLEPDDVAERHAADVARLRDEVLDIVRRRNVMEMQACIETDVPHPADRGPAPIEDDSPETRTRLAHELWQAIVAKRHAEVTFVDAVSNVGTSEAIELYRRLLGKCLGTQAENLDDNLDDMINMIEEMESDTERNGDGEDPMEITTL